ncbi:hypothetical protein DFH11DRAFT_1571608 [Phellopilus nigrolimitatus]|nr:hypothetical protein DFH11DRAFT_1571608 [Phellopilus nigrolimitatus]
MVRNAFLAPLVLPPAPQPGGLGLFQITGLLTPPPTPPPPPPAPFPYPNVGTGYFDEALSTAPDSPQLEGLEFSEAVSATLPTSPQLGGLGIYEPEPYLGDTDNVDTSISGSSQTGVDEAMTGSEVNENLPLEAQASFTPVTAPEPTDEESDDEEYDENQGVLIGHSPFLDSPNLSSSPLFAFAPR